MLTKELLRFQRRGGFKPQFADTASPALLDFAAELISLYADAAKQRMSREELESLTTVLLRRHRDPKFGEGLNKLLWDRCEFDIPRELDYPGMRRKLFACSAEALKQSHGDLDRYRELLGDFHEFMAADIYGDLPEQERLLHFRELYPNELLSRYNTAQVQGLLFYASEVELQIHDDNPAELRRVFKYLKFFRLLAELERGRNGMLNLHISGPFSLFANTRKYALQLANFFPALLHLSSWKLRAEIQLGNFRGTLNLDNRCGLVSHYRNFSSYVPEEIRLFHKLFSDTATGWKIIGDTPFIAGIKPELIFPDLSFCRESDGMLLHLELFHRWHKGILEKRLAFLQDHPDLPLILGIDRSLADDAEFALLCERYPRVFCYRFRDFPGVDRTLKMLNAKASFSACGDSVLLF